MGCNAHLAYGFLSRVPLGKIRQLTKRLAVHQAHVADLLAELATLTN